MNKFKTKPIIPELEEVKTFNQWKYDNILIGCIIGLILIFGVLLGRFTKVEAKTDYELNNNLILFLTEANNNTVKNIQKLTELEELQTETIICMKNKREALETKNKIINDCKILINKLYKNDNIK